MKPDLLQKRSATYPVSDPAKPVKFVLTWTDAAAPAGSGAIPTWLQNDLDLTVSIGHSTMCRRYAGNNLEAPAPPPSAEEAERSILYENCQSGNADTKNNVEEVIFFPNAVTPPVTQFTVVVQATRISASAIPDTSCGGGTDCIEQDFALFAYNAGAPIALGAPGGVSATAMSDTVVSVTWNPVPGAERYEISRTASVGGLWECCWHTGANAITGISQSTSTSYLYRVRALDPADNPGGYGSPALATTVVFTDSPLISGTTIVKAVHVEQLRTAVNAVRTLAGMGTGIYTDGGPLGGVLVRSVHVQELRANLDPARSELGLPPVTYSDSPLTGGTRVKAEHLTQLRNGVE